MINKIKSMITNIKNSLKNRSELGKKAFWIWVTYQCIKGTLTLSFIWIPLFILWFKSN